MVAALILHGTCVDIRGSGVLIRGKPGVGKSSLALQLIDRGAILVADDQTLLNLEAEEVVVSSPLSLRGMMEVRGIGLCPFPYQQRSFLRLCVEICEKEELERLPETLFVEYHQVKVPLLKLGQHELMGAIKVELKLSYKDD
jgi:serine kinase of HPr protein (carbohydrate metabolism regulator)